jgi:hypothetical protein
MVMMMIMMMMMVTLKVKTDRNVRSNKDIIICDNEKRNTYMNRHCSFRRLKTKLKELNQFTVYIYTIYIYRLYNKNTSFMESKGKGHVHIWGNLKFIQKLSANVP